MAIFLPVERVRALCDPFTNPWTDEAFTREQVSQAIKEGRLNSTSYSDGHDEWDTKRHIERIAFLAVHGWTDAIKIDVGIPSLGFSVAWPVQDGNHRLGAAIYRRDHLIASSVAGQVDFANELFGVDVTEGELESSKQDSRDSDAAPPAPIDADWSLGPWEASWTTRLVRQRLSHDCGVACLAMVSGTAYEEAYATFKRVGLDRAAKPFSSNFKQLMRAVARHGELRGEDYAPRMLRWRGWEAFDGVGILKVRNGEKRDWHWVVAERHPEHGLLIRDPAFPLAGLDLPPLNVMHSPIDRLQPYGNWISVQG